MPCKEMKELEASFRHQTDATMLSSSKKEARGMRYGEARVAYVMQVHRRACPICQTTTRAHLATSLAHETR